MTLLGDMVTDDVDFVNVVGFHWKGRQQVVDEHAAIHRDRFKNSVGANERVTCSSCGPTSPWRAWNGTPAAI